MRSRWWMVASTARVARKSPAARTWSWVATMVATVAVADVVAARAAAAAVSVHRATMARSDWYAAADRRTNRAWAS
jgi:hypothetical protein